MKTTEQYYEFGHKFLEKKYGNDTAYHIGTEWFPALIEAMKDFNDENKRIRDLPFQFDQEGNLFVRSNDNR